MAAQLRRTLRELLRTAGAASGRTAAPLLPAPRSKLPLVSRLWPAGDEWAALHEIDGPAASQLLQDEGTAAEAFFADTAAFEARVQSEAAYLLKPEGEAPPELQGDWQHFERHTEDGFVVYCRAPKNGGVVEVMLDTSELAKSSSSNFADVPACKVSPDGSTMAYVVDLVGDESYELRLRSLGEGGGEDWSTRLPGVRNVAFLGSGDSAAGFDLLTVQADSATHRACRIEHHRVARDGAVGVASVLWDEANEAAYLEVFNTKDLRYVLLSSNTKDTSEVRAVACCKKGEGDAAIGSSTSSSDAGRGGGEVARQQLLLSPREGVEYFVEHQAGYFYIVSNHERPDFRVYRLAEDLAGLGDGGWQHLQPFFTPSGGMHVTDADVLDRWLVLYGHDAAEPKVCVVSLEPETIQEGSASSSYLVELPSAVGSVEPGVNADPSASAIRFTFRSPLEAGATYEADLATGSVQLLRRREWSPHGGPGPEAFECERLEYPARDGESVPLTLVRARRDVAGGLPRPCLVNVYGAYGQFMVPDFRPEHIVLLRQGWTIAWAHVRGGGERGRAWHAAGRQLSKARSVLDLLDGLRFLLARGIAAPGALCVKAASAGGFTLGALLNCAEAAPLVSAAVLEVPFVDVLTGMSDPSLPLTVHEFSEWGDPRDLEHETNLRSLSPYENIGSHVYPRLYLSCARADARVPAWMPLKYVARLRSRSPSFSQVGGAGSRLAGARRRRGATGPATAAAEGDAAGDTPCVVLHCADGGHSGAADWDGRSQEFARQIAFLHKAVGLPLK